MIVFLAEMGCKSALILAVALAMAWLMRTRPPAERSDLLRGAVVLLPLLALVHVFAPLIAVEAPWLPTQSELVVANSSEDVAVGLDYALLISGVYGIGVAMCALRLIMGLAQLDRWARRATPITDAAWTHALVASGRRARLLVSDDIVAPLSCGWLRPVILIDRATLRNVQHAPAIIAHEAAHIGRGDWIVLTAMHVAAALFWFNPLVWMAKQAAEQYAEENADQRALRGVDAPDYAQALLDCAQGAPVAIAVGMAHRGSLRRRMALILRQSPLPTGQVWMAGVAGAITLCFSCLVAAIYVVAPQALANPPLAVDARTPLAWSAPQILAPPRQSQSATLTTLTTTGAIEVSPAALLDVDAPTPDVTAAPAATISTTPVHAAEDPRRARWNENARRNLERNERREDERLRRDRARENTAWVQTQTHNN